MSNTSNQESVLAQGFYFNKRDNAPDWVVGNLSAKAEDAIEFLKEHTNERGWVNMQILISKEGKPYIKLDTYVKGEAKAEDEDADF